MKQALYPAFGVLLVDDEPAWLDSLSLSLERTAGITNTVLCSDSRRVMEYLATQPIGLVLLDLTMPHMTGQDLLRAIAEQYPETVVIVLSGLNQIDTAVGCMKIGAFDYFVKTVEEERLIKAVMNAIRMIELKLENQAVASRLLGDSLEHPEAFSDIVSVSKTMRSIFQYSETIARSPQPILVTGESGVGKELIARAIHTLSGCPGPMVCVNVAGLDDSVFADTLFGHLKGAFTGAETARNGMVEEAASGTLFLDEIGDLTIPSQIKLLRILNDGEYFPLGSDKPKRMKARVIVATHHDLAAKIGTGAFRKDLFYRLMTHRLHIPPLRERKEDLPLLLNHFLADAAHELDKKRPTAPKELLHLLGTYSFPGNVRELRAMVFDAVARHRSGVLSIESFLKAMGLSETLPIREGLVEGEMEANLYREMERLPSFKEALQLLIEEAMRRAKGNQSMAARLLGISQSALNKRLRGRNDKAA